METKRKYHRAIIEAHNQMRMEQVGQLLREYRNDNRMSREEFAKEHQISKSLLERAELGKNITMHSFYRICDSVFADPKEIMEILD